jgi:hypothetical protein
MKNQKGFVIPLIIAIVAVLVVGGSLYFYGNKKVETPENNPVASSTVATFTIQNVVKCGSFDNKIVNPSNFNPTESEKKTIEQSLTCINQAVIKCIPASLTVNNIQNVDGRTLKINIEGNGKLGCNVSVIKYTGEKITCPLPFDYINNLQKKFITNNYDYSIISGIITDISVEISSGSKDNGCTVTNLKLATSTTTTTKNSCTPNWQCGWGECKNGYQGMTAVDSNNCGLPSTGVQIACPALARGCEITPIIYCPVDSFFDENCVCRPPSSWKIGSKEKGFNCVGGV